MQEKTNMGEASPSAPNMAQEFFYFRCPQGHENRIAAEATSGYERLPDDRIVVQCQTCAWRSQPFAPALFQHTVPGDVLIWVYTTKEARTLQSGFHFAFAQPSPAVSPVVAAAGNTPVPPTVETVATMTAGASAPVPAPETTDKASAVAGEFAAETLSTAEAMSAALSPAPAKAASPAPVLEKTKRISRDSLPQALREINADTPAPEERPEPTTAVHSIADTVEMAMRAPQPQPIAGNTPNYGYGFPPTLPRVQVTLPWLFRLFQTVVWLAALATASVFALRSCENQADKIAAAIRSVELKTVVTPAAPRDLTPADGSDDRQQAFLQQQQALQKELQKQLESVREWQKNYETLQANYQSERRTRLEAEKQLELSKKAVIERAPETAADKNYGELQQAYQALLKSWQRQFSTESLYVGERDFLQPSFANDGTFFLFYEDQPVARSNKIQKALKVAIVDGSELKSHVLFQTREIQEKQGEIPFIYSWDGGDNAALLTRIEGDNTIHHIRFQVSGGKCKVAPPVEVITASYPEVVGPPSISPNGQYVAWVHKSGNELAVRVYNLKDASLIAKTVGGGDTSKVPAWSIDSKTLFFLTLDQKGILAWKFLSQEKYSKVFGDEVYGRYLSVSPDGRQLAFLRRSGEGKGKVDLCVWDVAKGDKGDVRTLLSGFLSAETCRPAWGMDGRFVAVIRSGVRDEVVLQDVASETAFTVFDKAGKIPWIDWSCPNAILFSYKEGLFTRPYRARIGPWQGK